MEERISIVIKKAGVLLGERTIETEEGLVSLIKLLCDNKSFVSSNSVNEHLSNIQNGFQKPRMKKMSKREAEEEFGRIIYKEPRTHRNIREKLVEEFYSFLNGNGTQSKTLAQCHQFFRAKLKIQEHGLEDRYATQVLYAYADYLENVAKRIVHVDVLVDKKGGWKIVGCKW